MFLINTNQDKYFKITFLLLKNQINYLC
jgi:hypothetical protein